MCGVCVHQQATEYALVLIKEYGEEMEPCQGAEGLRLKRKGGGELFSAAYSQIPVRLVLRSQHGLMG